MSEPVYVGMPPTDRTFQVGKWGKIRCGGACRSDYQRVVAFHSRSGQVVQLQAAARDSFLSAEKRLRFGIVLTGSLRTCDRQEELYRSDSSRFANPNTTGHTRGLCIDVSTAQSRWRQGRIRRALLARGWHQSRPTDEPWHYSFGIKV